MNKAIIKKYGTHLYGAEKINSKNEEFKNLVAFIVLDIIDDTEGTLEALNEPEKYCFPGEFFSADLEGENVIIEPYLEGTATITIPRDKFIQIIHEWDKIIKTEPKKIIITEENGKYSFDAEY